MNEDTEGKGMGQVIQIDEARIRAHLGVKWLDLFEQPIGFS